MFMFSLLDTTMQEQALIWPKRVKTLSCYTIAQVDLAMVIAGFSRSCSANSFDFISPTRKGHFRHKILP